MTESSSLEAVSLIRQRDEITALMPHEHGTANADRRALLATVDELLRRLAAAEQNDRRYRWLREAIITRRDIDRNNCVAYVEIGNRAFSIWDDEPEKLDAAIDAAQQRQGDV